MNKILSIICLASFLVSGFSAMPVMAEETPEICSETSSQERASWSLSYHNAGVSNYNGSVCVSISTQATEKMEVIGVKDLTVQYSYDGNNWYDEWNAAGSFYSGSVGSEFVAEI